MKILVIGSGGREHALSWKIAQSKKVSRVYVAPGNAGTELESKITNLNLATTDELINFVKENEIDFTVVGPEAPLANGIVDKFRAHNLKIWGPTQYCAQLESSKSFAKQFMHQFNIPTANYQIFNNDAMAKQYLTTQSFPIVIKADGLAAGKGVLVAENLIEANNFIDDIFNNNKFGSEAGSKVVIEEFLIGTEASFIVMIDGKNILAMATSQDHKRLLDNDHGPNTGGMGAYSPAPIVTTEIHQKIIQNIIQPVIDGMKSRGHSYTGFLYAGLMIDNQGNPKTLEFNCRFGDPETQPIMMRLNTDLVDLLEYGFKQQLHQINVKWNSKFALGVVLASYGYPDKPRKGDIIHGLNDLDGNVKVFHAGSKKINNQIVTDGGRVLCVVGLGDNIKLAQDITYKEISKIKFSGMQYRTDIGNKAI